MYWLLFPHISILILLLFSSIGTLTYAFIFLENTDPLRIASYVLSFYTLIIWCVRIPRIVRFFLHFKNENRYAKRWIQDTRLRMKVTLTCNVIWNVAYALLQFCLGLYHKSTWFFSLSGYYFSLAFMRFFLVRYTFKHKPRENMRKEIQYYRVCGWVFLFTNLALSSMIFYMIYENRIVKHHEITTIAMAAYTFITLTIAIMNVIKYRKYHSPVFTASKIVSLAAACVSMLTLEGTMLATFSDETMTPLIQRLFLSLTGGAVSIFIVSMAIYIIINAKRVSA